MTAVHRDQVTLRGGLRHCKRPTDNTDLLSLLRASKDLAEVSKLHEEIHTKGLLRKNRCIGSALISMYTKCHALLRAQEVLDELPVRDIATWNALLSGHVQHGHGDEAFDCFEQMSMEGLCPSAFTFSCILKACGITGAVDKGEEIHGEIVREEMLGKDVVLGNALINMYARCGEFARAEQVLDDLPVRNIISWSTLIAEYSQCGQAHKATTSFERMKQEGLSPDMIAFASILKAYANIRASEKGERLHVEIVRQGLVGENVILSTSLVDMYAKCGELAKAQQVLDELPFQDIGCWNALISGYIQHGGAEDALFCFDRMQNEGHSPDATTFTWIVKACGMVGAIGKGKMIHNDISKKRLLKENVVLGNALVDMYAKCGALAKAEKVFLELPARDAVAWNSLITGYAQFGEGGIALKCFEQMQCEGLSPDAITFTCMLKACGSIQAVDQGQKIHTEIVRQDLLRKDTQLGNALVDMYARCGAFAKAQQTLQELSTQDCVAWNALISGYINHGYADLALTCFEQMEDQGIPPDAVTYGCILKACGSIRDVKKGQEVHMEITIRGLLENHSMLGIALVDMYVKCSELAKAREVLDRLPFQDIISWSLLITGYTQHEQCEEALNCFEQMQYKGFSPDSITFACILKACGSIGALDRGIQIHREILKQGLVGGDIVLNNALLCMYSRCGALAKVQQVFDGLHVWDCVSWNTLIAGYAQHGYSEEAIKYFGLMLSRNIHPDAITFISVLNACSHSGLVDDAEMYFVDMSTVYAITPNFEHHTCMVDLFGRAGQFNKAVLAIKESFSFDSIPIWVALLGGCWQWGNVKLGSFAFNNAVQLGEKHGGIYISMTNIYAAAGMLGHAQKIEAMRLESRAWDDSRT